MTRVTRDELDIELRRHSKQVQTIMSKINEDDRIAKVIPQLKQVAETMMNVLSTLGVKTTTPPTPPPVPDGVFTDFVRLSNGHPTEQLATDTKDWLWDGGDPLFITDGRAFDDGGGVDLTSLISLSHAVVTATAGNNTVKLGVHVTAGDTLRVRTLKNDVEQQSLDVVGADAPTGTGDYNVIMNTVGAVAGDVLKVEFQRTAGTGLPLLDFSDVTISASAAPTVNLLSPDNATIGELEETTLTWEHTNAETFDVEHGPTGNMSVVASGITATSYAVTSVPGTTHQWRVTAHGPGGDIVSSTRTYTTYYWGMTNSLITDGQAATVNALDYRLDTTPIIECYPTTNGTTGWRPNTAGIIDARLEKLSGEWVWKHVVDEQYASGNQRSLMRCSLPTHSDLFGKFATNTGNKNVPAGKIQIQGGLYNPGPGQMKTSGIMYLQGDTEMQLEFEIMFPAGSLGGLDGTPTGTSWIDNTFTTGFFCQGLVRGSTYSTPGPDFFIGLNFSGGEYFWYFGEIGLTDPPGGLINNSTFSLCRNAADEFDVVKLEEDRWYKMVVNVCTSRAGNGFTRYLIDGNVMHANNSVILSRGHATDPTHFPDDTTVVSIGGYWSGLGAANGGHSPPRIATHYTRNHMISKVGLNTSGSPA